eukprot:CAMPEP_0184693248 /NCGR_PEP_ID=MMETSP0313-20130426/1522_1 /TAXON_ID=2792 /ORGANISM="Porphyridium aerugineum, Strain SAG 1380-2" /LENGTH=59 /DNA_ID=CAMNT_0027151279 /DNA_START=9 /DNA_END=185 /DNA_ORIENTATION=+
MTNIKMEVDLLIAHIVWKLEFGNRKLEIGDMLLGCWSNGPAYVQQTSKDRRPLDSEINE